MAPEIGHQPQVMLSFFNSYKLTFNCWPSLQPSLHSCFHSHCNFLTLGHLHNCHNQTSYTIAIIRLLSETSHPRGSLFKSCFVLSLPDRCVFLKNFSDRATYWLIDLQWLLIIQQVEYNFLYTTIQCLNLTFQI